MRFRHTKCGGEIDIEKRLCTRCKKHWNPIAFRFNLTEIRPIVERQGVKPGDKFIKVSRTSSASWASKVPGLLPFVSRLPKWPRWVRVLTVLVVIAIVVAVIIVIRRVV